ncbi:MAG: hypothetical protein JNN30_13375 [Rhodanobacteraceae bacterium]|nr:hypothetical protein [Rhodanobacteraceae bacterium]
MPRLPALPVLSDTHASLSETLAVLEQRERLRRRGFLLGSLAGAAAIASAPLRALATGASLLPPETFGCALVPTEVLGPFPADGTTPANNPPNALIQSGIVRSDIRSSFGASGTAVASGTLLTMRLRFVSTVSGCAPVAGLAIHLWHCDAAGLYSLYEGVATTQNYLRGVQVTDNNGEVTFTTIFPGCYPGRWPHMHFQVFPSLAAATLGNNAVRVSQLALPENASAAVYAQTALYPGSATSLGQVSLETDIAFQDGSSLQMADTSGNNANGYAAVLEVGVAIVGNDVIFTNGFQ